MLRVRNWTLPLLAVALAISFTAVRAIAEDAKKETGTISGVVQDKDGKPVSGVDVGVFHPMGKHAPKTPEKTAKTPGEKPIPVVPQVTSDDKGEFKIADVPAGDYTVIARLKGQGQARENVTVEAGKTATLELKLKKQEKKPADPAK